jgi:uncharacterized membrane protein
MNRKTKQRNLDKWHKDPNNWKLGLFYYNKEDKRIFLPKNGLGWMDCQFPNPISVAVLAIVLIL